VAVIDLDEAGVASVAAEIADDFGVPTLGVAVDIRDEVKVGDAVGASEASCPRSSAW
jgi:Trk K+ transport system NAD-binding subunit